MLSVPDDILPVSDVLLDRGDWLVGVPRSAWAAAWWGAFTQWCTASDWAGFEVYARTGLLIVFIHRPSGRRWQLHARSGEFRDDRNRLCSWRGFVMRHAEIAGALLFALGKRRRYGPPLRSQFRHSRVGGNLKSPALTQKLL